jgi:hypothetical protein
MSNAFTPFEGVDPFDMLLMVEEEEEKEETHPFGIVYLPRRLFIQRVDWTQWVFDPIFGDPPHVDDPYTPSN